MSRGANARRAAALKAEAELRWLETVSTNGLRLHAQYVSEGGYQDRRAVELMRQLRKWGDRMIEIKAANGRRVA